MNDLIQKVKTHLNQIIKKHPQMLCLKSFLTEINFEFSVQ